MQTTIESGQKNTHQTQTKESLLELLYMFSPRHWDLEKDEFDRVELWIETRDITTFEELAELGIIRPEE